ncbi:hypothetical protein ACIREO_33600 [Streptomyces sp. NPDC102441]|uniref:hypothetical protein n=1 Tax=Streptomyces sp. NPDC102441 TaxID=3366176 RepID=UPI00381FA2CA
MSVLHEGSRAGSSAAAVMPSVPGRSMSRGDSGVLAPRVDEFCVMAPPGAYRMGP